MRLRVTEIADCGALLPPSRLPSHSISSARIFGCCLICLFLGSAAIAQDEGLRYLTDVGTPPISAVISYTPIGGNTAVVVDNADNIFQVISDQLTTLIAQGGAGPCELQEVTSYTVSSDTLYVLDAQQSRITGYHISSGDCTAEINLPELARFSSIGRVGGSFYLARTKYTSVSPSDETLLYRLSASGTLEPLGLTVADLEADLLITFGRIGRRISRIKEKDGVLYFLLPLSHRVWRYDTRTDQVSSIILPNKSPDISEYSNSTDPETIGRVLIGLEMELDLFLIDDYIVVMSNFQRQFQLGVYSYSGDLVVKDVSRPVDFAERGSLYFLKETDSESTPYSIQAVALPQPR